MAGSTMSIIAEIAARQFSILCFPGSKISSSEEILRESLPDRFFLNYSWIEEQIAEQKKDTVKNQ